MARIRPLRDLGLAVTLLTALPLRAAMPEEGERVDVASWFPFVGLVFGSVLAGVAVASDRFLYHFSPAGVTFVLLAMALATRFLHFDGLADVADAWFVPRERRLEVLADTHIGAFGATAIAFSALLEVFAIGDLASTSRGAALLVLAPTFGRGAATFAAWLGRPARAGGLGASVMGAPSAAGLAAALSSVAASVWVAWALGAGVVPLMVVATAALVLAAAVPHLLSMRFGGVTGDVMGASVVLTEIAVVVTAAVAVGVLRLVGVGA